MEKDKIDVSKIKPVQITFADRLNEDKLFLVALIDDPFHALKVYGYNSDDKMLSMLNAIAVNVRTRARLAFIEISRAASDAKGCQVCDACNICKVCGSIGMGPMGDPASGGPIYR
jgi:hypothetical protein